jgi:ubiquinone/menaquinone biosynthesis C-methylase UbiE
LKIKVGLFLWKKSWLYELYLSGVTDVAQSLDVSQHYGLGGLMEKILAGLAASNTSLDQLSIHDLAPVDEFHTRGRRATVELAAMTTLSSSDYVLDVGCGLGGSTRYLAYQYGCRVEGLDLTEEYIQVGKRLTNMVGLSDRISLTCGNALQLPYDNDIFDMVWTEHVQMNIEDKQRFYGEISRVLKPEGHFLFHDVFRSSDELLQYPVPWAEDEKMSFLADVPEVRSIIGQAALEVSQWMEKTSDSIAFFSQVMQKISAEGPSPVGIHLLMGSNAAVKLRNYLGNLEEGRVCVVMGVAQKQSAT